jgi:hypothetical protein
VPRVRRRAECTGHTAISRSATGHPSSRRPGRSVPGECSGNIGAQSSRAEHSASLCAPCARFAARVRAASRWTGRRAGCGPPALRSNHSAASADKRGTRRRPPSSPQPHSIPGPSDWYERLNGPTGAPVAAAGSRRRPPHRAQHPGSSGALQQSGRGLGTTRVRPTRRLHLCAQDVRVVSSCRRGHPPRDRS